MNYCSQCGNKLNNLEKFCPKCGFEISDVKAELVNGSDIEGTTLKGELPVAERTNVRSLVIVFLILLGGMVLLLKSENSEKSYQGGKSVKSDFFEDSYSCGDVALKVIHNKINGNSFLKLGNSPKQFAFSESNVGELDVVLKTSSWIFIDKPQSKGELIDRTTGQSYSCIYNG